MTIGELATEMNAEEGDVARAIVANGFSINDIDASNQYLVEMYVEYLQSRREADTVKDNFKYSDGEESVDKTRVYDQYRDHYRDLHSEWKDAKETYDRSVSEASTRYYQRKRADWLDRKRTPIRRTFR